MDAAAAGDARLSGLVGRRYAPAGPRRRHPLTAAPQDRVASDTPAHVEEASDTDGALVLAAQRGDRDAFEALVRRHLAAAHGLATRLTGNPDDADDVCQDAFLTALEKIRQCREPERFRAWLLTIVRNRINDQRRRARVRAATVPLASVKSPVAGPVREAARAELREQLNTAMDSLTKLQREVLVLHDYEGLLHREIAEKLGVSVMSSRFNLHRARKAMRAKLSPRYAKEQMP